MLLSAIGYLAVLYFVLFELVADEVEIGGRFGFALFYPIFVLILIPSALWMPLTKLYADKPRAGMWVAVRTVLFIVGLASIALAWAFFASSPTMEAHPTGSLWREAATSPSTRSSWTPCCGRRCSDAGRSRRATPFRLRAGKTG